MDSTRNNIADYQQDFINNSFPPVSNTNIDVQNPQTIDDDKHNSLKDIINSANNNNDTTSTDSNGIPDFSNLTDLRDYINRNYENGILNMSFTYSGREKITSEVLLDLITIIQVSYTYDSNSVYNLTLTDYTGNKIIKAYNSGDYSSLTQDELAAMNKAERIVAEAKQNTSTPFELELYLHDKLALLVDYNYNGSYVTNPENPPRHLTVVGALLDNSANCQGYADAFYVLATMAGFEVSRLSVTSDGVGHMVNLIKLDGNWYVVDVTFNDTNDTSHPETCSYMSFNIGRDFCDNYEWNQISEYHRIADKTDYHFYYLSDESCIDFGYKKIFRDPEELAEEIVEKWVNFGISDFHVALLNDTDDSLFYKHLKEKISKTNKSVSYSYTYSDNSRDIFFHVTLK